METTLKYNNTQCHAMMTAIVIKFKTYPDLVKKILCPVKENGRTSMVILIEASHAYKAYSR